MNTFENCFVYPDKYGSFPQRFHSESIFELFKRRILYRIQASPNNTFFLTPPNGLLLYGPPCNGKTVLAKQFAQSTGFPYIVINRYNLLETEYSHLDKRFLELMSQAKCLAPAVIILDNVESIIPNRKMLTNNEDYVDIMSILSLIQGCGNNRVYVFATTSKPLDIDPQLGMSGYLNELIYVPFPEYEQRLFIINQLLSILPHNTDLNTAFIARECENFTVGDIISLIEDVSLNSAIDDTIISNEIIQETLMNFRHPFTSHERKKYDDFHTMLNSRDKQFSNRTIGF